MKVNKLLLFLCGLQSMACPQGPHSFQGILSALNDHLEGVACLALHSMNVACFIMFRKSIPV